MKLLPRNAWAGAEFPMATCLMQRSGKAFKFSFSRIKIFVINKIFLTGALLFSNCGQTIVRRWKNILPKSAPPWKNFRRANILFWKFLEFRHAATRQKSWQVFRRDD